MMIRTSAPPQAIAMPGGSSPPGGGMPGLAFWEKISTGRVVIRSSNGLKLVRVVRPAISSSGAVSPTTRAMASVTPVTMPPSAVGSTTLAIVRHFGTPRAYDASRRSSGTSRSISSVERTTIGIISSDSATEPPIPARRTARRCRMNSANANRPATIDGMPVITSTRKVMPRASRLPLPYSTR